MMSSEYCEYSLLEFSFVTFWLKLILPTNPPRFPDLPPFPRDGVLIILFIIEAASR